MNGVAIFKTKHYKMSLEEADGDLIVIAEEDTDDEDPEEYSNIILTPADCETLGQLLLRFSKTGTTEP